MYGMPLPSTRTIALLAGPFLAAGPAALGAQTIAGRVVAAESGAPIADATVVAHVAGTRSTGVVTGPTGSFALRLPVNAATIVAMRIGFAPETLAVGAHARRDTTVTFRLRTAALSLSPTLISSTVVPSYSAASASTIRDLDIRLRPRESSQDLLRLVPGLVIAQHAGGGKAEQIFLRGFDADHGTDVAISLDGTPVNMVTHGHGQGYADLHFVMPEVIDHADVRKGPYDARDGDLATAGAVALTTRDRVAGSTVQARGGSWGTQHAIALLPFGGDASQAGGYVAGSYHFTNGPFVNKQGYGRANMFVKWTQPVGRAAQLVVSGSAFSGAWNASGEVPERAVNNGTIDRFGALDPTEGGRTERYDAGVALRSALGGEDAWQLRAWITRYTFQLWSNFTFFSVDSTHGDEIEQGDDRTVVGVVASGGHTGALFGRHTQWLAGAGVRADFTDVRLFHDQARARLARVVDDRVRQENLFVWVSQRVEFTDRLRLELGVRADAFRFDVTSQLPAGVGATLPVSGVRTEGIVSPKASLAYEITPATTLFANVGKGFHSNDARSVVAGAPGAVVLPRATGVEVGARHSWDGGSMAAALWGLDLESELVWSGDEGTTSASGRTRRYGIDIEARVRLTRWLWADADVNVSEGRFVDAPIGADRIPLAPRATSTGGITVRDVGPASGGVRWRAVGARPAIEDNSIVARGYTVWELFARWHLGHAAITLSIDNVFDRPWNEAQFATTSRLRGEAADVTELHFTPGNPRTIGLGVEWAF